MKNFWSYFLFKKLVSKKVISDWFEIKCFFKLLLLWQKILNLLLITSFFINAQDTQEDKIKTLRKSRDEKILQEKMKKLSDACKKDLNLVPFLIEVAEQGGTVGEIVEVMKKVYGEWEESFGI